MIRLDMINKLKKEETTRTFVMLVLIMFCFLLVYLINNVFSHFEPGTWLYYDVQIFTVYPPAGNDFRVGYYNPAHNLIESHFTAIGPNGTYPSNYPPLVALSGLPYALFDATTAYAIHVVILILTNLANLVMVVLMVKKILLEKLVLSNFAINIISTILFFVTAVYIFTSYFFLFSIERGNTDSILMFYCLLAMWVLIKRPNNIWLQVILLSVAVHFKIYPIVLFPILLFKHGKKLLLPALLVNLAFLFCLGPKMAWEFIQGVTSGGQGAGIGNVWAGVGNHAAYSFSIGIDTTSGQFLSETFFIIWGITFLIPFLVWAITAISIFLKKYSTHNAVLFFMICFPIMCLLPTYSIDYRLVIFGIAIVILLGLIVKHFVQKFTWFDLIQVVLLAGVLLMLSRSAAHIDENLVYIRNKYVWILLLEVFMSVNIFRSQKKCYQTESETITTNALS